MILGTYVFDETQCGKTIAIKVVDMLGEEVLAVVPL